MSAKGAPPAEAGVVDQAVDRVGAPPVGEDLLQRVAERGEPRDVRDVEGQRRRAAAPVLDEVHGLGRALRVRAVGEDDAVAAGGELDRCGATDAGAAPGDDDGLRSLWVHGSRQPRRRRNL
jgi:hypothetical protein